jgi:hypothetical protein
LSFPRRRESRKRTALTFYGIFKVKGCKIGFRRLVFWLGSWNAWRPGGARLTAFGTRQKDKRKGRAQKAKGVVKRAWGREHRAKSFDLGTWKCGFWIERLDLNNYFLTNKVL